MKIRVKILQNVYGANNNLKLQKNLNFILKKTIYMKKSIFIQIILKPWNK